MRKIELIELIEDHLSGGDNVADVRSRYHPEIIAGHLALAFKKVIFDTYLEAKAYNDYSTLDVWGKNIGPLTIQNINNGNGYVRLPYPPVQLPNSMGIRQVYPEDTPEGPFAYRENNSFAVFNELEVGSLSTTPYFSLQQNNHTGEYESHILNVGNLPDNCTEVDVLMIVPFEKIDDFDEVVIPAGKEDLLVQTVIGFMSAKKGEDEINDKITEQR